MPATGPVSLAPIGAGDLAAVGAFLHTHLNRRISAASWARMARPSWAADWSPNHGFLLRDEGGIVGVYLAFYSERSIDGEPVRFCNLAAWCVLEPHRAHGLRLVRAMLGQRGYTFTDLSPSGNVVPMNRRLRFADLDTTTVAVPNLPLPARSSSGARVVTDPATIRRLLTGGDLRRYDDHVAAAAAHQMVLVEGDRTCHVVVRRDRRKRLPLFATVLHVSDPELFARHERLVYRHLLRRLGAVATLVELRLVGHRPRGGRELARPRARMFRSDAVAARQIDYLYSELTCVAW